MPTERRICTDDASKVGTLIPADPNLCIVHGMSDRVKNADIEETKNVIKETQLSDEEDYFTEDFEYDIVSEPEPTLGNSNML